MPSEPSLTNDFESFSNILKFKNHHHTLKLPIVAYADFESILVKVGKKSSKKTFVNNIHEPMSLVCTLCVINLCLKNVSQAICLKSHIFTAG